MPLITGKSNGGFLQANMSHVRTKTHFIQAYAWNTLCIYPYHHMATKYCHNQKFYRILTNYSFIICFTSNKPQWHIKRHMELGISENSQTMQNAVLCLIPYMASGAAARNCLSLYCSFFGNKNSVWFPLVHL